MGGTARRVVGILSLLGLLAAGDAATSPAAAAPSQVLRYRVIHAQYGDIGSYSNTIEQTGATTDVLTRAHIEVRVLGIVFHREDVQRSERWEGDRLIAFRGTTVKNGSRVEIKGQALGDSFVIQSPRGSFTAPGTVRPANPWSAKFLSSDELMHPATGVVERVRLNGSAATMIKIEGGTVPAREYDVEAKTPYKVWLDDHGVPLMFSTEEEDGKVTFVLTK